MPLYQTHCIVFLHYCDVHKCDIFAYLSLDRVLGKMLRIHGMHCDMSYVINRHYMYTLLCSHTIRSALIVIIRIVIDIIFVITSALNRSSISFNVWSLLFLALSLTLFPSISFSLSLSPSLPSSPSLIWPPASSSGSNWRGPRHSINKNPDT